MAAPRKVAARMLVPVALGLLLAVAAGCVTLESFNLLGNDKPAPPVCQIVATWNTRVMYTPDPTHGGVPTPGIAGRLYLFGEEIGFPLVGDGSVTADLYDDSPKAKGGQPILLEQWRIDRDTLKRLLRRDPIGWGYTLFLPWGTYKPEIRQVHLMLRYEPQKGAPLFAPSSPLMLEHEPAAAAVVARHPVPGMTPPMASVPAAGAGPSQAQNLLQAAN